MNKESIVQSVLEILDEEYENYRAVSKRTRAAGNDSETKAEGKYDTRSIEENYLADGLARQAAAAADAAVAVSAMKVERFGKGAAVDVGALVQVEFPDETAWFLLAPAAGGIEVEVEGVVVTVLTPESPLGSQLIGKKVGGKTTSPPVKIISIE